jgi:hypothetical protein
MFVNLSKKMISNNKKDEISVFIRLLSSYVDMNNMLLTSLVFNEERRKYTFFKLTKYASLLYLFSPQFRTDIHLRVKSKYMIESDEKENEYNRETKRQISLNLEDLKDRINLESLAERFEDYTSITHVGVINFNYDNFPRNIDSFEHDKSWITSECCYWTKGKLELRVHAYSGQVNLSWEGGSIEEHMEWQLTQNIYP